MLAVAAPISPTDIQAWFDTHRIVDPEDTPAGTSLTLLAETAETYRRHGVLGPDIEPALYDCCPNRAACWPPSMDAKRPPSTGGRAAIALPWVGPKYRPGGVAVLAMNLKDAGGLLAEYGITCRTGGDPGVSQISALEHGRVKAHRSTIAYASARAAAAALAYVASEPVQDITDPSELAPALEATARLQAVKCSPDDNDRSSPTAAMTAHCPRLFLAGELRILQPSLIVAFGAPAYWAVRDLDGYTEHGYRTELEWGRVPVGAGTCEIFTLNHPASTAKWTTSHRELIDELRGRQAAAA